MRSAKFFDWARNQEPLSKSRTVIVGEGIGHGATAHLPGDEVRAPRRSRREYHDPAPITEGEARQVRLDLKSEVTRRKSGR